MGSGNGETDIYGPENFMDRDIVFVTINYRLSALGIGGSSGSKTAKKDIHTMHSPFRIFQHGRCSSSWKLRLAGPDACSSMDQKQYR